MIINWIDVIQRQLLAYGLSLDSTEDVLSESRINFNKVLRDLHDKFPQKEVSHMLLAMSQHYEVEFLVSLLDEELMRKVKGEKAAEYGTRMVRKGINSQKGRR